MVSGSSSGVGGASVNSGVSGASVSSGGVESVTMLSSNSSESSYKGTVVLREGRGRSGSGDKARRRMSSVFTSDSARRKWRDFEKKVSILPVDHTH